MVKNTITIPYAFKTKSWHAILSHYFNPPYSSRYVTSLPSLCGHVMTDNWNKKTRSSTSFIALASNYEGRQEKNVQQETFPEKDTSYRSGTYNIKIAKPSLNVEFINTIFLFQCSKLMWFSEKSGYGIFNLGFLAILIIHDILGRGGGWGGATNCHT